MYILSIYAVVELIVMQEQMESLQFIAFVIIVTSYILLSYTSLLIVSFSSIEQPLIHILSDLLHRVTKVKVDTCDYSRKRSKLLCKFLKAHFLENVN